jgi:hypothetical protein
MLDRTKEKRGGAFSLRERDLGSNDMINYRICFHDASGTCVVEAYSVAIRCWPFGADPQMK